MPAASSRKPGRRSKGTSAFEGRFACRLINRRLRVGPDGERGRSVGSKSPTDRTSARDRVSIPIERRIRREPLASTERGGVWATIRAVTGGHGRSREPLGRKLISVRSKYCPMVTWKRDAASGLIVLTPIIVTLYVIAFLFGFIANLPLIASIPSVGAFGIQLDLRVPIAICVFALLVLSIGYLMRTAFGGLIEQELDRVMNRLPGLRVIYNASKMAVETAVTGTADLQKPVRLEVWDGLRMTAFKTGQETDDGRELLFLPTAPNITTGFVIEVEPDRYEETDERVEEALTRVLSGGFGETREATVRLGNEQEIPAADD
jgi:uncharacterized membrane protein